MECRDYSWVKAAIADVARKLGADVTVETIEVEDEDFDDIAYAP